MDDKEKLIEEWAAKAAAFGTIIKAAGDMEIDVLGAPYFGPHGGKDRHKEFFSPETNFHFDKFGLPPAVYYHGFGDDNKPMGAPEYIGKAVSKEIKEDGVWFRVILNKASEFAKKVWEAAKAGLAVASTGSVVQLARYGKDGHITEWPIGE